MWGGYQPGIQDSAKEKTMTSLMDVYHLLSSTWELRTTSGNPPLGVEGHSSFAIGRNIFYFGGLGSGYRHNSFSCFNVDLFNWKELTPSSSNRGPMMKGYSGMVGVCFDDEYYLAIIGGRGSSYSNTPGPKQPGAQYSASGRCNEIHYYKISSGQ
uniref:Uncharacterized protein n=1 Tax=Amphimedon queenslandica TaxID=400682 RepID=A0A1X7SZL7_AMPQE